MNREIITIEQLPVITERLQDIKAEITEKVENALSLICTSETLTDVKKTRADLNKQFKDFEERRKEVKNAIMQPYNRFDEVYKDCITDVFRQADMALKGKIDSVELTIKEDKKTDIEAYFYEYAASKSIKFLTFDMAGITVTLSASIKSLKEQAKAFIDRVCDDLSLIETQEHKDEILYYYRKVDGGCFLNASLAIRLVNEKFKAIEAEKVQEKEWQAREQAKKEAAAKVEAIAPPTVEPIAPPVEEEPILTLKFTVRATRSKLKELKEYLERNYFDYE